MPSLSDDPMDDVHDVPPRKTVPSKSKDDKLEETDKASDMTRCGGASRSARKLPASVKLYHRHRGNAARVVY